VTRSRKEAFSDGVIAVIIITIIVLELKAPPGADVKALLSLLPVLLSSTSTAGSGPGRKPRPSV